VTVILPDPVAHRKAAEALPRPQLIIGGALRDEGAAGVHVHINPSTGEEQGEVPLAGAADVDAAVAAARKAYPGWRDMEPAKRRRILDRFCDLVEENADRFKAIAVVENGLPMMNMIHGVIPRTHGWMRYYAGWTDKIEGLVTGMNPGTAFEYTVPEPYGVIAHIITWNAPLLSLAMKVPPSIAAGNTVVVKPSELTPFSAQLFAELGREAGLPDGVINVVPGGSDAGEALVRHPGVDKISFTGGPAGAKAIMRSAAETLKPLLFELGGKSANLIFPDVDIEATAAYCAAFGFNNSGQGCALPTRLIVHEAIYDQFVEALTAVARAIPNGDPMDATVVVGPMVNAAACQRVLGMIDEAKREGAGRIALGGDSNPALKDGNFVSPTLIVDADPYSRIAQTEIFGPVLAVMKFRDEAEGVTLANATEYGLAAFVQTNDLNIAQRMVRRLHTGTVYINQATPATLAASPFGGVGLSGFGREGGRAGLDEFIRHKAVAMSVTDAG
jgi:aldehyde dehydrogenase (NAD+)